MPLRLGGGPVLVHKDALVHYDHALTARSSGWPASAASRSSTPSSAASAATARR